MSTELMKKLQSVNADIHQYVMSEFTEVKIAAEHMAECATNIRGQGYPIFISSRNELFTKIDTLQQYIDKIGI